MDTLTVSQDALKRLIDAAETALAELRERDDDSLAFIRMKLDLALERMKALQALEGGQK